VITTFPFVASSGEPVARLTADFPGERHPPPHACVFISSARGACPTATWFDLDAATFRYAQRDARTVSFDSLVAVRCRRCRAPAIVHFATRVDEEPIQTKCRGCTIFAGIAGPALARGRAF